MLNVSEKIEGLVDNVKTESYYQKTHAPSLAERERMIDNFLDWISDFKKRINSTTEKLNYLINGYEELTWVEEDPTEEELKEINNLIALSKDLKGSLVKHYVSCDRVRRKNIAKEELKNFKAAIDDFEGAYCDLEHVFFDLANDKEFKEITKKLSQL